MRRVKLWDSLEAERLGEEGLGFISPREVGIK